MPRTLVAPRVLTNKNQQRKQPLFVPWRLEKCQDIFHGQIVILARQLSERRDRDTEEAIAFAVLTRPRLEEPPVDVGTLG